MNRARRTGDKELTIRRYAACRREQVAGHYGGGSIIRHASTERDDYIQFEVQASDS